jgi:hypothetical protein
MPPAPEEITHSSPSSEPPSRLPSDSNVRGEILTNGHPSESSMASLDDGKSNIKDDDRSGEVPAVETDAVILAPGPNPHRLEDISRASATTTIKGRLPSTHSSPASSYSYAHSKNADVPMAASTSLTTSTPPTPSPSLSLRKRPRRGSVATMIELDLTSANRRRRVTAPVPAEAAG